MPAVVYNSGSRYCSQDFKTFTHQDNDHEDIGRSMGLLLLISDNMLTMLCPSHAIIPDSPIFKTNSIQSDKMSEQNRIVWRIVFSKL